MTTAPDKPAPSPKPSVVGRVAMRVRLLESLRLVSGQFSVGAISADAGIGYVTADPAWSIIASSEETVALRGDFTFLAVPAAPSEPAPASDQVENIAFLKIVATFEVRYSLEPGPIPSEDELQHFGRVNGTLNVYPYWREFVSSVAARAELPPILLPPFNPLKPPFGKPLPTTQAASQP